MALKTITFYTSKTKAFCSFKANDCVIFLLQQFLSMKLASVNPRLELNTDNLISKDVSLVWSSIFVGDIFKRKII